MLKLLLNFPSSSFHGKSFILLIPLKEMNRLRHSSEDCACSTTFPKQKIVSKAWPGKTFLSPLSGFQLSNIFVYSYMMTVEKNISKHSKDSPIGWSATSPLQASKKGSSWTFSSTFRRQLYLLGDSSNDLSHGFWRLGDLQINQDYFSPQKWLFHNGMQ